MKKAICRKSTEGMPNCTRHRESGKMRCRKPIGVNIETGVCTRWQDFSKLNPKGLRPCGHFDASERFVCINNQVQLASLEDECDDEQAQRGSFQICKNRRMQIRGQGMLCNADFYNGSNTVIVGDCNDCYPGCSCVVQDGNRLSEEENMTSMVTGTCQTTFQNSPFNQTLECPKIWFVAQVEDVHVIQKDSLANQIFGHLLSTATFKPCNVRPEDPELI